MGITIQLPPSSPQFLDSRFKFHRIAKLNHTCVGHRIYPPFSSRQPLLCHSVLDAATHNILAMISVAAATATISRTDESNSHSQLVCACVCLAHSQADRRFYCISWHAYYAQPHLNHIHARLHGQNGQISRKTNGWRYINSKELQRLFDCRHWRRYGNQLRVFTPNGWHIHCHWRARCSLLAGECYLSLMFLRSFSQAFGKSNSLCVTTIKR